MCSGVHARAPRTYRKQIGFLIVGNDFLVLATSHWRPVPAFESEPRSIDHHTHHVSAVTRWRQRGMRAFG